MSWADKLRAAVGRITAPAALATAGITVLGGLIVSPFGATFGHAPGTFAPTTAVVSSSVASVYDAPLHGFVVKAARPRMSTTSGTTARTANPSPHDVYRPFAKPADDPCEEHKDPLLPQGLPAGIGYGGSNTCRVGTTDIIIGPALPDNPTGYTHIVVSSNDVTCDQLTPATDSGVVSCTQEKKQP